MVFSDKTLTHMCIVKPVTKGEMLNVSGVGEFKYEKYGERFLACVQAEMNDRPAEMSFEGDDLYFTSDSDAFDDWSLETALTAWEYGAGKMTGRKMAAWDMAAKEMTAKEMTAGG